MTTLWAATGRQASGHAIACAMDGARLVATHSAPDQATALSQLPQPTGPVLHIGEGTPAKLPAAILPATPGNTLAGFTQDTPPDVIGAWVRVWIAGFLALHPNWDGVITAQEGDIRHWIAISADEAVSCQGFLTPRLVTALGGADSPEGAALSDSLSRPERLAAHLRTAQVRGAPAALTGHLLGAELAAARPYWLGQQVALIAARDDGLSDALASQGVPATHQTPDSLMEPGLAAIGRAMGLVTA